MMSPPKTNSPLSEIPEERNQHGNKSSDSLFSSTSSSASASIVYSRKVTPNKTKPRHNTFIPATNEVRQRVLSARRLRIKTFQNQLADAQQTISELAHENRMLRTVHKRQDSALSKYEATNADLPQLLHAHAEEVRVWQTKYRNLQTSHKDLQGKMKQKEVIILSLNDQNKYFNQLNKDKNLEERQRLSEKLLGMQKRLDEKDEELKLLARKMNLEAKNFKQQLQNEQKRTRDILLKLEKTRLELSSYHKIDEMNLSEKLSSIGAGRRPHRKEDNSKLPGEKVLDKRDYNNEQSSAEDTDFAHSNRSAHINKNEPATTRAATKVPSKVQLLSVQQSQTAAGQSQKKHSQESNVPVHKPLALPLRRIDIGDGDAPIIADLKKQSPLSEKLNKPLQSQPSKSQKHCTAQCLGELEQSERNIPRDHNVAIHDADRIEANDELIDDNFDEEEDGDDEQEDDCDDNDNEQDDLNDDDDPETIANPSSRMKDDISSIRKQISDDYKEREAFLDTFCRQATNSATREEPSKRNSITLIHTMPSSRKHKLLAALKAIDDTKHQD